MLIVGFAVIYAVSFAIDKEEVAECIQLDLDAGQYRGFYLAKWQYDMCKAHGIEIQTAFPQTWQDDYDPNAELQYLGIEQ